jgi:type IV pilus assembly protein PilP
MKRKAALRPPLVVAWLLVAVWNGLAVAAATVPATPSAPAPAAPAQSTPAPAPVVEPQEYRYDPVGRRDPFKSLLVLQEKKRDITLLPPIQQVDLSAFKVIGIVLDPSGGNKAMLQAPDSKTYVVKKGDVIGRNEGEIQAISRSGIAVREKFVDFMNKETVIESVIGISDKLIK